MRSTSRYCFILGSGIFSWCSKKQNIVAQSIVEVELLAATATTNQALWLRKVLLDLNLKQEGSTEVFVDNQATISIFHDPIFHGKTKSTSISSYSFLETCKKMVQSV